MALVSAQAKLRIRDLFATLDPAVLAAREAIAWIREREWQLVSERAKGPAQSGAFQVAADAAQSRARYFYYVRQEILDLVPASAKVVVDVGCASGALGAGLKRQRPGVEVRGVEISPEAAALAREVLDDVYCGSADASPPSAWPRPDCVIFADVLEHLQDPWSVLRTYRALLGVGGKVVVSVPNIGHRTVIAGLLRGKFEYADAGILDRSHLRFFTKASAIDLLEGTGFKVEQVTLLEDLPTKPRWIQLAQLLRLRSAFLDDFQAVQFLILATAV
jgi:2-polyprenyl-3-methyl-5-hydroxy-6-metoxy-1,4-benzoquinol methylase